MDLSTILRRTLRPVPARRRRRGPESGRAVRRSDCAPTVIAAFPAAARYAPTVVAGRDAPPDVDSGTGMVPDPKEDLSDRAAADVTTLLAAMSGGDGAAVAEIWTRLHDEFRAQAHGMLADGAGSLQPTELIGMAFQRIQRLHGKAWANRAHFQAVVALSMHSALVDRARARARRVTVVTGAVDEILVEVESRVGDLAQFEDALLRFEAVDPVMAKALRLRCLGYGQDEVATMLALSRRSLDRSFARARAYVHRLLA